MHHIVIDPEYQSLIPALGQQEFEDLTQALLRDGCREPLSVMEDVDDRGNVCYVLLDGHNRHQICESLGLPYEMRVIHGLMSRDEIRQWIIQNQLGRRNLTADQMAYYRGEQYRLRKTDIRNPGGRNQHGEVSGQNVHKPQTHETEGVAAQKQMSVSPVASGDEHSPSTGKPQTPDGGEPGQTAPDQKEVSGQNVLKPQNKTAQGLAREYGVDEKTIRRDAQYAEAVDRLVSFLGPDFRRRLLAHKTGLTKKDVLALAGLEDKKLRHIATAKMDLKRCARTVQRQEKRQPSGQMEFSFVDEWYSRVAEARDALHNGDRDAVESILADLLDQIEKVKNQHAAR